MLDRILSLICTKLAEPYPVGSYFETSDSSFDPNNKWVGTWAKTTGNIQTATRGERTLNTFKATAAKTWQYTGNSIVVPTDHVYVARINCGWSAGKPIGVGINAGSTTLNGNIPTITNEDTNGVWSVAAYLTQGTWYVFDKRETVPSLNNGFWLFYTDIDFSSTKYRWHRTA